MSDAAHAPRIVCAARTVQLTVPTAIHASAHVSARPVRCISTEARQRLRYDRVVVLDSVTIVLDLHLWRQTKVQHDGETTFVIIERVDDRGRALGRGCRESEREALEETGSTSRLSSR
jgi:hypothetical protein